MSSSAAESPIKSSVESSAEASASASPPPALLHDPDAGTAEAAPRPAAVLKGGPRGLEFLVDGRAKVDAIAAALCTRLAEAPAFFRGSSVRVRVEDGPLAPGVLARIDDIATRFELRILEVGAARAAKADPDPANPPDFATGSTAVAAAAAAEPAVGAPAAAASAAAADAPGAVAEAAPAAGSGPSAEPSTASVAAAVAAVSEEREADTRIVIGPVRSGVILEHRGNLIVVGDVNPGAEIRAERNIIVLGRLRGIAHAGIGRTYGFILALKLEPQQLRIARQVARAGDADGPVAAAEIAYVTSNKIVVERYAGKLPLGLANSM
jgi:septum site-determining protein MinC